MKYIKIVGKYSDKIVKVDDKDYKYLSFKKWYINSSGYATDGKIYMHQLILPKINGKETEHKNGNKLDNCRDNLRYATRSQNQANRRLKKRNTISKYKGVSYKDDTFRRKPWRSTVTKDNKVYRLGDFATEKEAALIYNKKAIKLFGEFAALNNVF